MSDFVESKQISQKDGFSISQLRVFGNTFFVAEKEEVRFIRKSYEHVQNAIEQPSRVGRGGK